MNESCHTYKWFTSHIRMSHVTRMNESCHTYEWVKSHTLTRPVTHMNKSFHRYRWITLHIRTSPSIISHVTHMNEPCHTYQWVLSHMWTSHFTHGWSTIHIWMKRQFSTQIESCKKSPIISGSFAKNALISHTWMKQDTRLHASYHFLAPKWMNEKNVADISRIWEMSSGE